MRAPQGLLSFGEYGAAVLTVGVEFCYAVIAYVTYQDIIIRVDGYSSRISKRQVCALRGRDSVDDSSVFVAKPCEVVQMVGNDKIPLGVCADAKRIHLDRVGEGIKGLAVLGQCGYMHLSPAKIFDSLVIRPFEFFV